MDQAYKSQLQSYALKQNLELPVYATERQGPPHAPRFRSKVTFVGTTYQSQEFFPTLKASEHAAAKIALASIAPPQSPEAATVGVNVGVAYKNLLQEIAQKQNSLLPVYETVGSGPSHAPTFTSTVEFNGRVFKGEEAKTKKLAEMNAAKIAFMSIKYGNSTPNPNPNPNLNLTLSPPPSLPEAEKTLQEINTQQTPKIVTPDVPSKWVEVFEDDVSAAVTNEPANNANLENPTKDAMNIITVASSSSPPKPENLDNGYETLEEENEKKKKQKKLVIPNGSHVVVHPRNSEMNITQDTEVLFSDDRFAAYRLV